jgi:hypothetical protein
MSKRTQGFVLAYFGAGIAGLFAALMADSGISPVSMGFAVSYGIGSIIAAIHATTEERP